MAEDRVQLKYNGRALGSTVGASLGQSGAGIITNNLTGRTPCPLVTIETRSNKDADKNILSSVNTITLEGVILGTGVEQLIQSYTGLVSFFTDKDKQNSTFEIICTNSTTPNTSAPIMATYSGTSFVSANASKSENNWTNTLPYTIVLESFAGSPDFNGNIESYEDSWTIEPLEEVSYYDVNQPTFNKYELNTTNTMPRDGYPPSSQLLRTSTGSNRMQNFLQYRITHRVSAVGIPTKRGNSNNPSPISPGVITNNNTISAYQNAAIWVTTRVSGSVNNSSPASNTNTTASPTGIILKNTPPISTAQSFGAGGGFNQGPGSSLGLFLYNHVRSIESSPSAGSYGITDTWLALGTGINYTEEFTWEVTTDDKWVHTVTMNGTIKGLETTSNGFSMMTGVMATGYIDNALLKDKFSNNTITSSKFNNALLAYTSGVKPYLYSRAGSVLYTVPMPPTTPTPGQNAGSTFNQTWFGAKPRPLNMTPISFNETFNPIGGTITYNISYTDRPAPLLSGAIDATVSVVDTNGSDIVAEAFILGRRLGPIIQKVGTSKSERQLTVEAIYPAPTGWNGIHPQSPDCAIYHDATTVGDGYAAINKLVDAFKPVGAPAFQTLAGVPVSPYSLSLQGQIFKTSDTETWNPFEGRYTRNVTWIYNTGICT